MISQRSSRTNRLVLDWCEKGLRFVDKKGGATQAELDSLTNALRRLLPKEARLPSMALSDLTIKQVERVFEIKEVKDRDPKWEPDLSAVSIHPRNYLGTWVWL